MLQHAEWGPGCRRCFYKSKPGTQPITVVSVQLAQSGHGLVADPCNLYFILLTPLPHIVPSANEDAPTCNLLIKGRSKPSNWVLTVSPIKIHIRKNNDSNHRISSGKRRRGIGAASGTRYRFWFVDHLEDAWELIEGWRDKFDYTSARGWSQAPLAVMSFRLLNNLSHGPTVSEEVQDNIGTSTGQRWNSVCEGTEQ